jgi:hypothetical protein
MSFTVRPASTAWEHLPLPGGVAGYCWAWFKPPAAPDCVVIRLADETLRAEGPSPAPTARQLLQAAGIDVAQVAGWSVYGTPLEAQALAAVLDRPIPPPQPGADAELCIYVVGAESPVASGPLAMPHAAAGGDVAHIYDLIDTDWNLSLLLEKQLVLLRKQLAGMLTRITTIDRDLNPEERMHGDRQAKTDWQEARRWLKDSSAKLLRYIKEHDTGDTSNAGKREWFIKTYEKLVLPRRPIDNLVQVQRQFESHRKRLQILQTNMTNALQFAGSDGERRAQTVLERIARSVRDKRAKHRGRRENEPIRKKHLDNS